MTSLCPQRGRSERPHIPGVDFARTVADFVQEYGITHVVVGQSQRPWHCRLFGPSPLDCLLASVPGVDVVVDMV